MHLFQTYYFQKIPQNIILSHQFGISLRNPNVDEFSIFAHNIRLIGKHLSNSDKRRILFSLYPLGNIPTQGSLDEQFLRELTSHCVLISSENEVPLEQGLLDYGYLLGYFHHDQFRQIPSTFIIDPKNFSPKLAYSLFNEELKNPQDLSYIENLCTQIDRIFLSKKYDSLIALAQQLRKAEQHSDPYQKLIHYSIACEILLVHNPIGKNESKISMSRQFSSKLALIRYLTLKEKKQQQIHSLLELQDLFLKIYNLRSDILHGREYQINPQEINNHLNFLYPSLRLCMELYFSEPEFTNFLYQF